MEHFLSVGGASAIFGAFETANDFDSITDALILDFLACIKTVMNNKFGIEFIIAQLGENLVKKAAQGENVLIIN